MTAFIRPLFLGLKIGDEMVYEICTVLHNLATEIDQKVNKNGHFVRQLLNVWSI